MSTATLTSKGQTTVPQEIRHYLGLHTGDKLEFLIESDGRVFLSANTVDVKELKGLLPKPKKKVSIAQMNKAIAKRASEL